MLKRYIENVQAQPAHYRRQHAIKIATTVTAVVFVGWLASLGVRVSSQPHQIAVGDAPKQESQLSNAISGMGAQTSSNTLEVSTTTTYNGLPAVPAQTGEAGQ